VFVVKVELTVEGRKRIKNCVAPLKDKGVCNSLILSVRIGQKWLKTYHICDVLLKNVTIFMMFFVFCCNIAIFVILLLWLVMMSLRVLN
jgi:hypothetical protein